MLLTGCHVAIAAVLRSLRLLASTFRLGATQGLRVCNCFLALDSLLRACTLPWCHLCHSRRTTRGQQEGQKRTTGGQGLETLAAAAKLASRRGQQEDKKRRTRRGHKVGQHGQRTTAGQLQAPGGQEEDKTQTQRSWGATPLATSLGRVAP